MRGELELSLWPGSWLINAFRDQDISRVSPGGMEVGRVMLPCAGFVSSHPTECMVKGIFVNEGDGITPARPGAEGQQVEP